MSENAYGPWILASHYDALAAEVERLKSEHCKDCCCARSWRALGVTEYTGRSIPEHIEALVAEVERLRAENAMLRERNDSATACSGRNIERALDAEDRVARLLDGNDILDARNSNLLSQLNAQSKRIAELEARRAKICKCAYVTIRDDIAADHACPDCHGTGAVIEGGE